MGLFKRKKRNKFSPGGFRKYRNPAIFGSSRKLAEATRKQQAQKKKMPLPSFSAVKIFFCCMGAIILVWLLFFSDFFAIKDVFVEGNKLVPADEISPYAPKGHNIFFLVIKSTRQ